MNIAIIAPSSVPFVMGGAEHFWLGLQRYINEETTHNCELFKISSVGSNLLEIISSYEKFSKLDFSSYDTVVTGKDPAWIVSHPSHIVYMLHKCRGVYDTYHFFNEPIEWTGKNPKIIELNTMMSELLRNDEIGNDSLCPFFDELRKCLLEGSIDAHEARFPGPFSRRIVHFLDDFSMKKGRIKAYYSISDTVARRAEYFPEGAKVEVVYPPPRMGEFYCGSDEHLFTVSRLDSPKRIDLIVEAMRHVKSDIPLIIGGDGPERERLLKLAEGDSRIRFVGSLSDDEVREYYANSLAVPFVPYDEDYGLITVEAMKSSKPVITASDAGGVTEFVVHGETGFCVPPNAVDLASAIDYLCEHRSEARRMGERAAQKVAEIDWQSVGKQVLGIARVAKTTRKLLSGTQRSSKKPRLVVACTFPVYPPRGGGQSRIYNLYKELAREYDVTIVSISNMEESYRSLQIAPGVCEITVPKSSAHQEAENELSKTVDWVPITDIVADKLMHLTPDYIDALSKACVDVDIVVASGPYLVKTLRVAAPSAPLWYEAHNIELLLKRDVLPNTDSAKVLLDMVAVTEAEAWLNSELVYACAERDLQALAEAYGPAANHQIVVPNGFSKDDVTFTTAGGRRQVKAALRTDRNPTVLFMGSWHGPNLEAVEQIAKYAKSLDTFTFLVAGSAGLKFKGERLPSNLKLLGVLDDAEKQVVLSGVDLAINPMVSGSGSNLKMLDYFASGVPVISTPFGARGIDAVAGRHYLASDIGEFQFAILDFFARAYDASSMCAEAAELANKEYSWSAIAEKMLKEMRNRLPGRLAKAS
ncbi:glycosyltransferase family 4 protein [Paraburkholderia sp. HD33-4]|uniref:glycosyltransferase family 4 protein n=1 Tax=Paraburkholderia sp. HD33-4 TaxID=2883242 RepID=UPI001F328895|nr:glycosyltransferase family 4 protein [Paraburkholderia sp. HD33-4]